MHKTGRNIADKDGQPIVNLDAGTEGSYIQRQVQQESEHGHPDPTVQHLKDHNKPAGQKKGDYKNPVHHVDELNK